MSKKIVLTGGCGFIGHHFAEYIHKNTDWDIIIIDKLSYASLGLNRLRNNELLYSKRINVFTIDLCNELSEGIYSVLSSAIFMVLPHSKSITSPSVWSSVLASSSILL